MYERVQCERCGAHKDAAIVRHLPCFVCGNSGFRPVTRVYADISEIHSAIAILTADLVRLDPSPEHIQLAAALSDATIKSLKANPHTYERRWA